MTEALYANLSKIPTLLPNKRSEEQSRQAYKMLSDCYRLEFTPSCIEFFVGMSSLYIYGGTGIYPEKVYYAFGYGVGALK